MGSNVDKIIDDSVCVVFSIFIFVGKMYISRVIGKRFYLFVRC